MLDHLAVQCADVSACAAFYDAVLAPLGGQRVLDFDAVVGFGIPPSPRAAVHYWSGPVSSG